MTEKQAEKDWGRVVWISEPVTLTLLGEQTACSEVESICWMGADRWKVTYWKRRTSISYYILVALVNETTVLLKYTACLGMRRTIIIVAPFTNFGAYKNVFSHTTTLPRVHPQHRHKVNRHVHRLFLISLALQLPLFISPFFSFFPSRTWDITYS